MCEFDRILFMRHFQIGQSASKDLSFLVEFCLNHSKRGFLSLYNWSRDQLDT